VWRIRWMPRSAAAMTSSRVSAARLASSTPLRLAHSGSTGSARGRSRQRLHHQPGPLAPQAVGHRRARAPGAGSGRWRGVGIRHAWGWARWGRRYALPAARPLPPGVPAAEVLPRDAELVADLSLGATSGKQRPGPYADGFERLAVAGLGRCGGRRLVSCRQPAPVTGTSEALC
jgi:hypothetical protein